VVKNIQKEEEKQKKEEEEQENIKIYFIYNIRCIMIMVLRWLLFTQVNQ
jgi:hypothetical protein